LKLHVVQRLVEEFTRWMLCDQMGFGSERSRDLISNQILLHEGLVSLQFVLFDIASK